MRDHSTFGIRLAGAAVGLIITVSLAGCAGAGSTASATRSSSAATGGGEAGAAASGKAGAATSAPAAESGAAKPSTASGHEGAVVLPSGKPLTKIKDVDLTAYKFGPATAGTRGRFSALNASVKGVQTGVQYLHVTMKSAPAADIAIYSFSAAQLKSALFRGQILTQMVGSAVKSKKVQFDSAGGQSFAVATHTVTAVGSFDGDKAVIVLGPAGSKGRATAAAAAYAYFRH